MTGLNSDLHDLVRRGGTVFDIDHDGEIPLDDQGVPVAVMVRQDTRTLLCLFSWTSSGPMMDVIGYVDDERVGTVVAEIGGTANVRLDTESIQT